MLVIHDKISAIIVQRLRCFFIIMTCQFAQKILPDSGWSMVIAEKTKLIFLDYSIYYFQTQISKNEKNEPTQSFPDALFPFLFNLEVF